MTAQARKDSKASEQEIIDCPAPESMYRDMTLEVRKSVSMKSGCNFDALDI
jgi:hypothetical protein